MNEHEDPYLRILAAVLVYGGCAVIMSILVAVFAR